VARIQLRKAAQQRYQILMSPAQVYTAGPKGVRTFLKSEEVFTAPRIEKRSWDSSARVSDMSLTIGCTNFSNLR